MDDDEIQKSIRWSDHPSNGNPNNNGIDDERIRNNNNNGEVGPLTVAVEEEDASSSSVISMDFQDVFRSNSHNNNDDDDDDDDDNNRTRTSPRVPFSFTMSSPRSFSFHLLRSNMNTNRNSLELSYVGKGAVKALRLKHFRYYKKLWNVSSGAVVGNLQFTPVVLAQRQQSSAFISTQDTTPTRSTMREHPHLQDIPIPSNVGLTVSTPTTRTTVTPNNSKSSHLHDEWFPEKLYKIICLTEKWCDILTLTPPDGIFLYKFQKAIEYLAIKVHKRNEKKKKHELRQQQQQEQGNDDPSTNASHHGSDPSYNSNSEDNSFDNSNAITTESGARSYCQLITKENRVGGNAKIIIRILFANLPGFPVNCKAVMKQLTHFISGNELLKNNILIWVGGWRKGLSWNHSKIIAIDGTYLHTGGHNLWEHHYLSYHPVTDLSIELEGTTITTDAHLYANEQWNYIEKHCFSKKFNCASSVSCISAVADSMNLNTRISVCEYPMGIANIFPPKYIEKRNDSNILKLVSTSKAAAQFQQILLEKKNNKKKLLDKQKEKFKDFKMNIERKKKDFFSNHNNNSSSHHHSFHLSVQREKLFATNVKHNLKERLHKLRADAQNSSRNEKENDDASSRGPSVVSDMQEQQQQKQEIDSHQKQQHYLYQQRQQYNVLQYHHQQQEQPCGQLQHIPEEEEFGHDSNHDDDDHKNKRQNEYLQHQDDDRLQHIPEEEEDSYDSNHDDDHKDKRQNEYLQQQNNDQLQHIPEEEEGSHDSNHDDDHKEKRQNEYLQQQNNYPLQHIPEEEDSHDSNHNDDHKEKSQNEYLQQQNNDRKSNNQYQEEEQQQAERDIITKTKKSIGSENNSIAILGESGNIEIFFDTLEEEIPSRDEEKQEERSDDGEGIRIQQQQQVHRYKIDNKMAIADDQDTKHQLGQQTKNIQNEDDNDKEDGDANDGRDQQRQPSVRFAEATMMSSEKTENFAKHQQQQQHHHHQQQQQQQNSPTNNSNGQNEPGQKQETRNKKTKKSPVSNRRRLRRRVVGKSVPIISIGRYGSMIPISRPSDDAIIGMFHSAKKCIKLAIQDVGPVCVPGAKLILPGLSWPKKYIKALAQAIWTKNVVVEMILSNPYSVPGGLLPIDANYGNGWNCVDVASEIIKSIKRQHPFASYDDLKNKAANNLRICFIRNMKNGKRTWDDNSNSNSLVGLHSKHFIIDDMCCYIGSQNIYVCDLAEWGIIIDNKQQVQILMEEFWNPLWKVSYTIEDCLVEDVMRGLRINRNKHVSVGIDTPLTESIKVSDAIRMSHHIPTYTNEASGFLINESQRTNFLTSSVHSQRTNFITSSVHSSPNMQ